MKHALCSLVLLAGGSGCAGKTVTVAEMRGRLDSIARLCHLPASVFELHTPDELHFKPSPDERYENVDCALTALRKANLPLNIGFVGNEAYFMGNDQ